MNLLKHPYGMHEEEKTTYLTEQMRSLTAYHRQHCAAYDAMLRAGQFNEEQVSHYAQIPFLPVTLFKKLRLSSLAEEENVKLLTSSGTSGQNTSQIVLDGNARIEQQQVLSSIVADFIGPKRLPMLIIDCPATVKNRSRFSARTAAVLGFSLFGKDRTYALRDEDLSLDIEIVKAFLETYGQEKFLIFGFTFLIWQQFVQALEESSVCLDLSNAVFIHGGGWKKLADAAVSKSEFKQRIFDVCGASTVLDYYGMAEQSGSIFMECGCGHLHCSDYSGILVRRPADFSVCEVGETGLIQVLSVLPKSYPGHSLLTEDEGRLLGIDDCPCGRKGSYFEVLGRVKAAELRGCSDVTEPVSPGGSKKKQETPVQQQTSRLQENFENAQQTHDLREHFADAQKSYEVQEIFAEETIAFLDAFSRALLHHGAARQYSDLMAYAFWIRRGNMEKQKLKYASFGELRQGKGLVFHIASSNIPMMFAFSATAGLLAGNANIVRMPQKQYEQEKIFSEVLAQVTKEYPTFANRIALCRYGYDASITQQLTDAAMVRVLWGSDASIREIRNQAPLRESEMYEPTRGETAFAEKKAELIFGTRYSAALISAQAVAETESPDLFVKEFYNDTYLNDQNACSSPRILCWFGNPEEVKQAKKRFWKALALLLEEKHYTVPETVAVSKLDAVYMLATCVPGIRIVPAKDNGIIRVETENLSDALWELTVPGGFFLETEGAHVGDFATIFTEKCQTLTCVGVDIKEVEQTLRTAGAPGIDRFVPVGHALDFSLTWDGINLIEKMSRPVS